MIDFYRLFAKNSLLYFQNTAGNEYNYLDCNDYFKHDFLTLSLGKEELLSNQAQHVSSSVEYILTFDQHRHYWQK